MSIDGDVKEIKVPKWYFGGLAAAAAVLITHPIDLLKNQAIMQKGKRAKFSFLIRNNLKEKGVRGLYCGLSASVLRQLTYSTSRFGIYELLKETFRPLDHSRLPFYEQVFMAGFAGAIGGLVGTPIEIVNVRMQTDVTLPPGKRRRYRNVFHGLIKAGKDEGISHLFYGFSMSATRGSLMNISQITMYENTKRYLLKTGFFKDNVFAHIAASLVAGFIATTLCQAVDVMKTRYLTAHSGEYTGIIDLVWKTVKERPCALTKGYSMALLRLGPHTILTFGFLEELRLRYGTVVEWDY